MTKFISPIVARITMSDGYKFSMAEAGFPLREETFYYTHRRGGANGWHYMPVDAQQYVKALLPRGCTNDSLDDRMSDDYKYLDEHAYSVGAAARKAYSLTDNLKVTAIPKGSWFYNRESAFSVTGTSAIGSWLEPMSLMLHFRIQVATQAKINRLPPNMIATCAREEEIIIEACEEAGRKPPQIEVREEEYYNAILAKARALVDVVKNPDRIFEVGMRAVSCMEQHEIALRAIRDAGIMRTSNVYLAQKLGMIPVGTMGHEHIQRFGNSYQSFITMRDRFPGFISYLPDTFDSIREGIPAALKAMMECPNRKSGIRFDSEDRIRNHYWYTLTEMQRLNILQQLILESGWNLEKTIQFEKYRELADWPAELQSYGLGGYLVQPNWAIFRRDDVAAVWKLTKTGARGVMKFSDDAGKQSAPGLPVVLRPLPMHMGSNIPVGIIGQDGEKIENHFQLSSNEPNAVAMLSPDMVMLNNAPQVAPIYSPETQKLADICTAIRQANFSEV